MALAPCPAANPAVDASIAVLPFVDLSEKRDQDYFAEGLADEVTNDLTQSVDRK